MVTFKLKKNKLPPYNSYFFGRCRSFLILPETSAYVKIYDGQTKWMCFLIEDDDSLEKYNTI